MELSTSASAAGSFAAIKDDGNESTESRVLLTRSILNSPYSDGFISSLDENSVLGGNDDVVDKATGSIMKNSVVSAEVAKYFLSEATSSSSPPLSSWLIHGNVNANFSDYSYPNGFPFSTSPVLSYPIQSSTSEPILSAMAGVGRNSDNQEGMREEQDDTLSLPINFTEISELNKDCIIVYTILFILAAVSNFLVLCCVSRNDRLGKSRTPLLIMNLCIADLIVAFFLMPTEIFWRYTIAWKGGDVLCKFSQFVRAFGLYLSSNVVICISIDRYFAIVYPLKLAGAVRRVKVMLITAWLASAVFAGPQIFIYHVASHPVFPQFRQCVTKAFLKTGPYNELIYNVSSVAALYFIPLLVIMYTYTMILWKIHKKSKEHRVANSQETTGEINSNHLNRNSSPSQNHLTIPDTTIFPRSGTSLLVNHTFHHRSPSRHTRLMLRTSANQTATLTRARSRTLRLTFLILLTFIMCWTPYVVMTLWYMLDRGGASQVDERLQEALFIMAVTTSVLNPVIYGTVRRKEDCINRLHSLFYSTNVHPAVNFLCCGFYFCKRCCERGDRGSNETVVVTLNRMNGNSSRMSRGSNGINSFRPRGSSINKDLPSLSPLRSSPRSQIVTMRSNNNSSRSVMRFVRSFLRSNSSHGTRNSQELLRRPTDACSECGIPITLQFVGTTAESSGSQKSTHV